MGLGVFFDIKLSQKFKAIRAYCFTTRSSNCRRNCDIFILVLRFTGRSTILMCSYLRYNDDIYDEGYHFAVTPMSAKKERICMAIIIYLVW